MATNAAAIAAPTTATIAANVAGNATTAAAAAVAARNLSIEFIVKPKEDLYLEGSLRRLPRVTRGEPYPCQMQKTQNFSCLFRHYAKHNGLRKEDLVFSFVDELFNEQTPEVVHLMPQDEIWVEHRYPSEETRERGIDGELPLYSFVDNNMGMDINDVPMNNNKENDGLSHITFCDQLRGLLASGAHSDVLFVVGPGDSCESEETVECVGDSGTSNAANSIPCVSSSSSSSTSSSSLVESIPAHRAVLAARSEYFTAMFREGGMSESVSEAGTAPTQIRIRSHSAAAFRRMLEFLYSNSIADLAGCGARQVMALLQLANEYMLHPLRALCEHAASDLVSVESVGGFLLLSSRNNSFNCCDSSSGESGDGRSQTASGGVLWRACVQFVCEHREQLSKEKEFRQEVEGCAELGWLLFDMPAMPITPPMKPLAVDCFGFIVHDGRSRVDKRRRLLQAMASNNQPTTTDNHTNTNNDNDINHTHHNINNFRTHPRGSPPTSPSSSSSTSSVNSESNHNDVLLPQNHLNNNALSRVGSNAIIALNDSLRQES